MGDCSLVLAGEEMRIVKVHGVCGRALYPVEEGCCFDCTIGSVCDVRGGLFAKAKGVIMFCAGVNRTGVCIGTWSFVA